jgi:membrane protein
VKIPPAIQRAIDAVQRWPPVMRLLEILAFYNAAGGGLLAAGLAYGALFAALTGFLFAVGLVGFVIHDPAVRIRLISQIATQFPPLEPVIANGVQSLASNAGAFSILGLAGLGWSASQFYGSVDSAFGRIFRRAPERGPIERIARGLVSVLIVVSALGTGIVTSGIQAFLTNDLPSGPAVEATRFAVAIGYPLVTVVIVIAAVALIYRLVPNLHVPWRSLAAPAIVVGIAIAALTELFVFLAPRLVGSLQVFGGFAAVFAALTWLSWAFQALLIGGAWTRERLPDADAAHPGPSPDELRRPLKPESAEPGPAD